jgi:transposase
MCNFAGLDVSQAKTTVCIVNGRGLVTWRGSCAISPAAIAQTLATRVCALERVGLESGPLAPWLVHELRALEVPVVCLDARHARAALSVQINKSDVNDADGLAQIVRTGWYREVRVKSGESHLVRATLGVRKQLVGMRTEMINQIRGLRPDPAQGQWCPVRGQRPCALRRAGRAGLGDRAFAGGLARA